MSKTITVSFDKCGRPKIEAEGFAGCGCTEATQPIVDALSFPEDDPQVIVKPEMYETEVDQIREENY